MIKKRLQYVGLIVFAFFLFGCNNEQLEEVKASKNLKEYAGVLPESSIYNLTSTWTNQNGEELKLKAFRGKIAVFVMIYTSCTSSCPILISNILAIQGTLKEEVNQQVKYVFVSIDPETDTPKKLKEFAQKKGMDNPQYVFLRSSLDNTRTLSAVLGVNFKQVSKMDYKHSNIISVLDQNGLISYQKKGLKIDNQAVIKEVKGLARKK